MAQLVEHILGKDEVPGPNPGSSSRQPRRETFGALAFYRGFAALMWECCFFCWGCTELLPLSSRALWLCRKSGPHTPTEDRRARSSGVGRGYLRLGEYPGSSRGNTLGLWLFYRTLQHLCGSAVFLLGLSGAAIPFVPGFVALPQIRSAYPDRRSKSSLFRRRERVSSPWRIPGYSRCGSVTLEGKQHLVVF